MAFEPGNQLHLLGRKAKRITEALDRAILQEDGKRIREGVDKLLDAFADGEPWAIQLVWDRHEGKPAQAVMVSGDEDRPLLQVIKTIIVRPDNPNEINEMRTIEGEKIAEKIPPILESVRTGTPTPSPHVVISDDGVGANEAPPTFSQNVKNEALSDDMTGYDIPVFVDKSVVKR